MAYKIHTPLFGILWLTGFLFAGAQPPAPAARLNLIATENSTAGHYAQLYRHSLQKTYAYLNTLPPAAATPLRCVADDFVLLFDSMYRLQQAGQPVLPHWKTFFETPVRNPQQAAFLGLTAHIHGDMWRVLTSRFGHDSIARIGNDFLAMQPVFNALFDSMYTTLLQFGRMRTLHCLTLGLAKPAGKIKLYHWRKRQWKMALLHTRNPVRFGRKERACNRTMRRWNRFALRYLHA
ncbi:MAG: DUF5995 family protein [Lacibacter sp.]